MKLYSLIACLLLAVTAHAQSLDSMWKKVENAVKNDNPQEVILQAGKVYEQARKQKKVPEMLRAYLTRMAWRKEMSPDSLETDQKQLLSLALESKNPVDQAVMYFLYALTSDTDAASYTKKALALEATDATLMKQLAATSALNYEPIVQQGDASKLYQHDLLSLFRREVEERAWKFRDCTWMTQVFERDRARYEAQGNRLAALAVALEWDDFRHTFPIPVSREDYLKALEQEYADLPLCAEVEHRLADMEPLHLALPRLKQAIAQYPAYERVDELKEIMETMVRPSASFSASGVVYPGKPVSVTYTAFNVARIEAQWRKVNDVDYLDKKLNLDASWDESFRSKMLKKSVGTGEKQRIELADTAFARVHSTFSITAPAAPGVYYLEIAPLACGEYPVAKATKSHLLMLVSRWKVISVPVSDGQQEIQVLDAWTGKPEPDVLVYNYELKDREGRFAELASYKTNGQGIFLHALTKNGKNQYWGAEKNGDRSFIAWIRTSNFRQENEKKTTQGRLFTDRSIYRPGQVVEYSLLLLDDHTEEAKVVPHAEMKVSLRDSHRWTELQQQTLTTDDYGVAGGEFRLPDDCVPGDYVLSVTSGLAAHFKVEEYKRPTFDASWVPVTVSYAKGDTIQLKGKALTFTDQPLQGAQVVLKTICQQRRWWRMYHSEVIRTDTLSTDEKGEIDFAVALNVPENLVLDSEERLHSYYEFRVEMTVTSKDGETHEANTILTVADHPLLFWVDAVDLQNKNQLQAWTVHLTNLARADQKQEVKARLLTWGGKVPVWSGVIPSGTSFAPSFLAALPSGRYVLELSYEDLKLETEFALISLADSTPLPDSELWTFTESDTFDKAHEAVLQLGTSFKDACLQYHIYTAKGRVEKGICYLSDSLTLLHIPYKESYGEGVVVSLFMVHEGKVYSKNQTFRLRKPGKTLKAEWISIRDYSQPGMKEEWKLKLTMPNGLPADANLMAVLYDAALDRIYQHGWNLALGSRKQLPYPEIWRLRSSANHFMEFPALQQYKYLERIFDRFDNSLFHAERMVREEMASVKMMSFSRAMAKNAEPMVLADAVEEEHSIMSIAAASEDVPVNLRSEFQETAFFYPMLRTDREGVVTLNFTLPQSITEWHLLGMAHTREMNFTTAIDHHLKVTQPFEVHPNMPRFVRKGDKVNLPVTIRNFTGAVQEGRLTVILKDSTLTTTLVHEEIPFKVGESETLFIPFAAPDYVGGAVCQVFAKAEDYSDGEQHELPVLSDEIWLEESRAYYLNSTEQAVSLETLLQGGELWNKTSALTVSVVNNPIWNIVRDLSKEQEQKNPCNAVDLALAFYAQCLSAALAGQQPVLENNGMLATDSQACKALLDQLVKLQKEDGGFAWYEGMDSSAYITRLLAEAFARLLALGVDIPDRARFEEITSRVLQYLDKEMVAYYQSVKKQKNYGGLTTEVLHYLYLQGLNPRVLPKEVTELSKYFVNLIPKHIATFTIYQKAMAAIVLQQWGKVKEAQKFIRSVVSYSVYTEELGRYYDTPKATYSWRNYRIPTQTMVVEGLAKVAPEAIRVTSGAEALPKNQLLSEYIRWILNQKRTQSWENSATTLDALYAILNMNPGLQVLTIATDNTVSQTFTHADFEAFPKTWTLKKETSDSPVAWGSIAVKSLVKLNEVKEESAHTGLQLQVTYLREVVKEGKVQYETVALDGLRVGDKVRAVVHLKADRDMDFVEVRLPRATCLAPSESLSGYRWSKGLGYYYMIKDEESRFCMDRLPKGSYELTEDFYVGLKGSYRSGIPTVQCTYAPEFSAHGTSVVLQPE